MRRPNTDKHRFLLVGNGSYANRGCEAIVRGTVEVLSGRFPGSSFIVSSQGETAAQDAKSETDARIEHRPHVHQELPKFSAAWWRYRVLHRRSTGWRQVVFRAEYEAMQCSSCALQAGGDNYTLDYGRPELHMHLDEALWATAKPVVLWGASVGPFSDDPAFEATMREHLGRFSLVLARETETLSYLESIGLTDNVRLVADPAFLMKPAKPDVPDEVMRILDEQPIGINLSPLAGEYRGGNGDDWLAIAAGCVKSLLEANEGTVLLVPHVTWPNTNDHAFLEDIARALVGFGDRLCVLPPTLSASETKWVISRLRAFVGARTHATIAAFSTGVPTISIGYSAKARGINHDLFGHLDWLLPVQELSPAVLQERTAHLLSKEDEVRESLAQALPGIVSRAEKAGDFLAEVLERR